MRWGQPALLFVAVVLSAVFGWAWVSTKHELAALRASLLNARTVERAVDGDTLVLDGGERVRIIGVDAPELREKTPAGGWRDIPEPDPRAVESYEYIRSLERMKVRVTYEEQRRDRYGRTLAHLYLLPDGPDLGSKLVGRGWAKVLIIPPNTRRAGDLKAIEARRAAEE